MQTPFKYLAPPGSGSPGRPLPFLAVLYQALVQMCSPDGASGALLKPLPVSGGPRGRTVFFGFPMFRPLFLKPVQNRVLLKE